VPPRLTIEVTGHQWWWEARYLDGAAGDTFTTANELHIPTGEPVRIRLIGADVIHSFWLPGLGGKTDVIPGQTNLAWLQTDRPGVYLGQCAEYCGVQHAHMALRVVAQPPAAFANWQRAQLAPAAGGAQMAGEALFTAHCGACHTVRGSDAGGIVGPDLTHLMSRATIAAGTVPNTPGALSGWIANPQALKPGARMPATYLSGPQLSDTVAYLETLK
jgi:cytochrome c oxidase subunit 2